MTTPDGIAAEAWEVAHGLAVDIFNAPSDELHAQAVSKLLQYLDALGALRRAAVYPGDTRRFHRGSGNQDQFVG